MWIDKKFQEEDEEERLENYLAYYLGIGVLNEESIINLKNGILYILGHLTEEELRERYPEVKS